VHRLGYVCSRPSIQNRRQNGDRITIDTISWLDDDENPCAYRKSNPDIFVMQSAEDGTAKNMPALFTVRDRGASLSKAKCVRVSLIIVASVRFQNPA
jgi:hypothetical protein